MEETIEEGVWFAVPTNKDYTLLVDYDHTFYEYLIDEIASVTKLSFRNIYLSPRINTEKYFCLDYDLAKPNVRHYQSENNVSLFVVLFLKQLYIAEKDEVCEDIGGMYLPQHDRMLQIIVNMDGSHDLHVIHVPRNGTVREMVGEYLRDIVKIEPQGVEVCFFGKDPKRYTGWNDLAATPIKYFQSNEKILIREAMDQMNMAIIDDHEGFQTGDPLPRFGQNCPILKDFDAGSDVAIAGDQQNMDFLDEVFVKGERIAPVPDQVMQQYTNSTGASTPYYQNDHSLSIQGFIGKVMRDLSSQEIEKLKEKANQALEAEKIPIPQQKEEAVLKMELSKMAEQVIKSRNCVSILE